jgi:hypothetical protein
MTKILGFLSSLGGCISLLTSVLVITDGFWNYLPISSFGRPLFYILSAVSIGYVFLSELSWALPRDKVELRDNASSMGTRSAIWFTAAVVIVIFYVVVGQYLEDNPPERDWMLKSIASVWAFLAAAVVFALTKTMMILGVIAYARWNKA